MVDRQKPWEKRTKSAYRKDAFSVNLRFLILCEGQTEKEYFDSFDLSTKDVVCINCKGYQIAYSNDAFELWFYLHFQYPSQANHRTFYYTQLSSYLGFDYEKKGKCLEQCKNNYDLLKDKQKKAIKYAKQLLEKHGEPPYHKRNPATTVHLLVGNLNNYLRGSRHS